MGYVILLAIAALGVYLNSLVGFWVTLAIFFGVIVLLVLIGLYAPHEGDVRESKSALKRHLKGVSPDSTYHMTYRDSNGDVSNRTIKVVSVNKKKGEDVTYLKAVCFKANSIRTFRADRIVSLVDADTGEVII